MKQNANCKNRWLLLVLSAVSVLYVIWDVQMRDLFHHEPYAAIYVGKNGMRMQWDGFEWSNNYTLGCFFAVLSVVYFIYRLWQIRQVDGKRGAELLEAYPFSRKQRIRKDVAGSVSYLFYMSVIAFLGLLLLEGIAMYQLEQKAPLAVIHRPRINGNLCIVFWIGFLCLLFLIMFAFLCEVVMTNRYIAWLTGAFVHFLYHAVQVPDGFLVMELLPFKMNESYYGIDYQVLPTIGIAVGLLLADGLLYIVCVRLYQKREMSTNGLFYFPLAKDLFLCLCWLPVLAMSGFFTRSAQQTMSGRVRIAIGVLCGVLVLNYLVLGQQTRQSAKRLLWSMIRPVFLLAGASLVVLCVRHETDTQQEVYEVSYEGLTYYPVEYERQMEADELLNTRQERSAYFDTLREKLPGAEFPDVEGEWERCSYELTYYATPDKPVYTGYSVQHLDSGSRINYGMERNYEQDEVLMDVIFGPDVNAMRIVEDEQIGTIYCTPWLGRNRVTVFRYNEKEELWDEYWIWSDRSYEEMIADLRTYH